MNYLQHSLQELDARAKNYLKTRSQRSEPSVLPCHLTKNSYGDIYLGLCVEAATTKDSRKEIKVVQIVIKILTLKPSIIM